MKPTNFRNTLIAAALIGATALGAAIAAEPQQGSYGPGYGMGPGMMGPGMMGGSGYGPGMGPGMMGGGGYGMGPGMMGGMGYGMLHQLNLTAEQWNKVNEIQQDQAKKNWDLAGKMQEEAIKLRNLMSAEKRDSSALANQYKKLQEIQLQSFQATIDTQDKIEGVLTKEQKAQFHCSAPS